MIDRSVTWHTSISEQSPETGISKEMIGFKGETKVVVRLHSNGHIILWGTRKTYVGNMKENIWICWKRLHDLGVPDKTLIEFLNGKVSGATFLREKDQTLWVR